MRSPVSSYRLNRAGFTLIEMLMVFLIIAILAALLIPALMGARKTARIALVQARMTNVAQALELFKERFGAYPPSRIRLREDGAYDVRTSGNVYSYANYSEDLAVEQRSVRFIKLFWPKWAIHLDGTAAAAVAKFDLNQDGDSADVYEFDGAECLMFFLTGVPAQRGIPGGVGFSKDPQNPFGPTGPAGRDGPFLELQASSFMDFDGDTTTPHADGSYGYYELWDELLEDVDFRRPLVYFSSYGGAGYDPRDVNYTNEADGRFKIPALKGTAGTTTNDLITSAGPNPFSLNLQGYSGAGPTPPAYAAKWDAPIWINPNSYQLISAGDGSAPRSPSSTGPPGAPTFGNGGLYNLTFVSNEPVGSAEADAENSEANEMHLDPPEERDNLTNFHKGMLKD